MTALLIVLSLVLLLFALAASAQDGKGGPFDPALLYAYAYVFLIAMAGGVASFYRKVMAGQARWVNLTEFLGELLTSALAGLITFWLCHWAGVNDWLMAAFVGIAGHMGSRTMYLFEQVLERQLQKWFPPQGGDQ